jgi:hypothetical protein
MRGLFCGGSNPSPTTFKSIPMNTNEVKKDLYKSKAIAKLSHYDGDSGELVYIVDIFGIPHQFPLKVFDVEPVVKQTVIIQLDEWTTKEQTIAISSGVKMAADLKGAKFSSEIKGSDLNRWIVKAINNNELVKLGI